MKKTYYPELGEKKPDMEIEAEYSYAGKYIVKTHELLKGMGIVFRELIDGDMASGLKFYVVTGKALDRLDKAGHSIALTLLLD
jgi:hypothetical protein